MHRTAIVKSLLAAALVAAALAVPASATTQSQSQLEQAGWECIVTPTVTPDPHCARPGGIASVLAGDALIMRFRVFEPDGTFLGTELLIRGDVFRAFKADGARPRCPKDLPTRRYTYLRPLLGIDYYACHHFNSDHT
jgi:hypothetical protein